MSSTTTATHAMKFSALGRPVQQLNLADETPCIEVKDMHLYYGSSKALNGITMQIPKKRITAFIGPSGCGKSTLLRSFNRMNDLVDGVRIEGEVTIDGHDIYAKGVDVADLRRRVGMVFQSPILFLRQFMKTWPMVCVFKELTINAYWMRQWNGRCVLRRCGMKPKTVCMNRP